MKLIIKILMVVALFLSVSAINEPVETEAATLQQEMEKNRKACVDAVNKELYKYTAQAYKSVAAAIKAEGVLKGPVVYAKQLLEISKITKKAEKLSKASVVNWKCAIG